MTKMERDAAAIAALPRDAMSLDLQGLLARYDHEQATGTDRAKAVYAAGVVRNAGNEGITAPTPAKKTTTPRKPAGS